MVYFIDIDATLMFNDTIPKENIEAINKARKNGDIVMLNTGRSYGFVPKFIFNAAEYDGGIYGLGTKIMFRGECIYSNPLPVDICLRLIDMFTKNKKWLCLEGETTSFTLNTHYDNSYEFTTAEEFLELCKNEKISKFSSGRLSDDECNELSDVVEICNHPGYSEASVIGANKKQGIKIFLDYIGESTKNCVGIGDSANDLGMFEICNISAAMGNAPEEIKKICNFVACHSKDGGVAEVIKHFSNI